MDIQQLKHLLVVMELGSLNKAALKLGISQPALTKSVRRLELQLGVPLFTRETKGMRPTVFAQTLRDYARATCVGMEQSIIELQALRSGSSGLVTVGGPPLIAAHLFPEMIVRVNNKFPNLRVRIVEQIDGLFSSLLEGQFDLLAATITNAAPRQGLKRMWLFDDYLGVIARPEHPVTRIKSPHAKDLTGFRWVFSNTGNLHRRRLEQYFESENVPLPRPIAEMSAPSLVKAIVMKTDCIGFVAKMGVQQELDEGTLDFVRLKSPFMLRPIGLIWRSNHTLSAAAKNVVETIEGLCRERGQAPRIL